MKTVTFKNDPILIQQAIEIFVEEVTPLLNVEGFMPAVAFQPISLNILDAMKKNGGNALGLSEADGPLISKFRSTSSLDILPKASFL